MNRPENDDSISNENLGIDEEIIDIFGEFIPVTARFSLAQGASRDIIPRLQRPYIKDRYRFGRFLVVPNEMVDEAQWRQLKANEVSTIPLLERVKNFYVFGVMDGMRPLAHEALFQGQSSQTYVSDREIFETVGLAYRSYFEATKALPLNSQSDNPLGRLAIKSFIDERQPLLYFYPPFNPPQSLGNMGLIAAAEVFDSALDTHLSVHGQIDNSVDHIDALLTAAHNGFLKDKE